MRSSLFSDNPFFSVYRRRTHSTISRYNLALLSGKTPSNSSQKRQRSEVFRGFAVMSFRFASPPSLNKSFCAKSFLFLKYLTIKFCASCSVNPSISSRVSQCILTFIPASCRAVTTNRHFGSTLP